MKTSHFQRIHTAASIIAIAIGIIASPPTEAAIVIDEHLDVLFNFDGSEWTVEYRYGANFNNPQNTTNLNTAVVPVRDRAFSNDPLLGVLGDRYEQPAAGSGFEFTGATPGSPLWILTQADNNKSWPGLASSIAPGVLDGNTFEVVLLDLTYVGQASNSPEFSMWTNDSFGGVEIKMQTSDGIDPNSDKFTVSASGHHHMNWGFTALGVYQLELEARGTQNGVPTNSGPQSVTFTIGTYATWLGEHFSTSDLVDTSISGPNADPDQNGTPVLIDYAFNCSPVDGERKYMTGGGTSGLPLIEIREHSGVPYLTAEYVRRKTATNPQITYTPMFTGNMIFSGASTGVTISVQSVDAEWERVVIRDNLPATSADKRFATIQVNLLDSINY